MSIVIGSRSSSVYLLIQVGGWLEKSDIKLTSAKIELEVEVEAALGKREKHEYRPVFL